MDSSPNFRDRLPAWLAGVQWSHLPFAVRDNAENPVTKADEEKDFLGSYHVPAPIEQGWPGTSSIEELDPEDDPGSIHQLQENTHAIIFGGDGDGKSACLEVALQESERRRQLPVKYLVTGDNQYSMDGHGEAIHTLIQERYGMGAIQFGAEGARLLSESARAITLRHDPGTNIFVFIEIADTCYGPDGITDGIERMVKPFFSPGLMRVPSVWLKFFLSPDLADRIRSYRSIRSGQVVVRPLHIHWTEKRLRRYLSSRVEWAVGRSSQLQDIADDRDFKDLDGELIREAIGGHGAPRYLNRLTHEMIKQHVQASSPQYFRLTRNDLLTALAIVPRPEKLGTSRAGALDGHGTSPKESPFPRQFAASQPGPGNILIVTSTEVEATAVLDVFSQATNQPWERLPTGNKTYYSLGFHGGVSVLMAQCEMGSVTPGGSLSTVAQAITDFQPQAVIMCGIAFGLRPERQKLGDILVASKLRAYEPQKIDQRLGPLQRGDRVTCSALLLDRFRSGNKDWKGAATHFGLVLSGEKLVNTPEFRAELLEIEPEAIGGEMEGAGLYAAAHDATEKVDWILVKAIVDWADGSKTDEFQGQASHNAAQFVLHVLRLGGWRSLRQPSRSEEPEPGRSSDIGPIQSRRKILILSANPIDTPRLRCDEEIREIESGLVRSETRGEFELISKLAVRQEDVRRVMLDEKPNIVHFCGHGVGQQGLMFENKSGKAMPVRANALAGFFEEFKDTVDCVVLNACYSEAQAKAISQHIDYVIGTRGEIGQITAITFAVAFYDAIARKRSFPSAFNIAKNALDWDEELGSHVPVLLTKKGAGD